VDAPGLLTAGQARSIWKQLEALPDAPAPAANGKPRSDTVDLGAAAAIRKSDVLL
jgi:hypothetical protein